MASTGSDFLIIPVIIIFIIVRMLLRGRSGAKYSVFSIFLRPVIYTIITLAFLFILSPVQDVMLLAAIVAGLLLGLVLGKRSDIFETDGKVMYKRSNEVTILWMVGFVIRIFIDFAFNPALSAPTLSISSILFYEKTVAILFVADLLLAFTAGLLLGEAVVLYKNYNSKYKHKQKAG